MMDALARRLTNAGQAGKRLDWADNAKAILITLVVIGHFGTLASPAKQILYAFHVPAFLVITGYLLPLSLRDMSTRAFLDKYILPYGRLTLFFIAASIAFWRISYGLHADGAQLWDVIRNGFYGTQSQAERFLHRNGPIWYLPFLVSSFAGLLVAIRLPRYAGYVFAAVYALFSLNYHGPRWPWSLDSAGIGLLFIMVGHGARHLIEGRANDTVTGTEQLRLPALLMLAALLAVLTVAIAWLNGRTNINVLMFGHSPALLVLGALCGTALVVVVSMILPGSALARHLSKNTLVIFCIHIFAVRVMSGNINVDNQMLKLILVVLSGLLITLICSYISTYLMPYLTRYVLANGQRGRTTVASSG